MAVNDPLVSAGAEAVAKRRLQSLVEGLGASDLEDELTQAARLLRAELPSLPAYAQMSADDQSFADLVIGLRAAMSLLSPAILGAHKGLAKLKEGDVEYTFTVPSLSEREEWAKELAQAMGYLVKLARSLQPGRCRPAFSMFGAAGVARARARREYSLSPLVRLLVPGGWVYEGWFEIQATAETCL